MQKYYSIFDAETNGGQIGLALASTDPIEDYKIDDTTKWCIIGFGITLILIATGALLSIMKPLSLRTKAVRQQLDGEQQGDDANNDRVKAVQSSRPQQEKKVQPKLQ